jgi:hypothetical protein
VHAVVEFLRLCWKGAGTPAFWALVAMTAFQYAVPFLVQRALLARMSEERRDRAWNDLTWAVAILHFQALSMLPFCWVTRRRSGFGPGALALLMGVGWTALVLGLASLGSEAIAWVFGVV